MLAMKMVWLILMALQASQSAILVRGDRFQVAVPQGWKTLVGGPGGDVLLEHSSGASLLLIRTTPTTSLDTFAQQHAESIMSPLGFAKLGEPRHFKDTHEEWVQYEIRGNRLSEHRRILYRAIRRGASCYELVYENSEDRFDVLLTEAQEIASSLQPVIEAPPAARRRVRR
jgi:hypothetical protein